MQKQTSRKMFGLTRNNEGKELLNGMVKTAGSILIVDDSEYVRELVTLILKGEGYDVIEAVHGKDALDKLSEKKVEAVITDLKMPVMNGIEFIRRLRRDVQYKFMPVIVITSEYFEANKLLDSKLGADELIMKPFSPQHLTEVITKLLNNNKNHKDI